MIHEALAPLINVGGGLIGAGLQGLFGNKFADKQYARDKRLMEFQLDYNSPMNQMKRFREAGLNPNLIYGQGSPGNLDSPPRAPQVKVPEFGFMQAGLGTQIQQARLLKEQADFTAQKNIESGVKQDLMRSQKSLIDANPNLQPTFVQSMVTNMESIARLKKQEADFMTGVQKSTGATTQGEAKMMLEVNSLAQRFELGQMDLKIKAEIIQSKEFQNALTKLTLDWLKDGEMTYQTMWTGFLLLMQKMM